MKIPAGTLLALALPLTLLTTCSLADEKADTLLTYANKNSGMIQFKSGMFEKYVQGKTDYTVIGMTTALASSRGCQVCSEAYTEFKILVDSFRKNHPAEYNGKKLFFALIDYDDAGSVFHLLKLNSAPGFFHFSPTFKSNPDKSDKLDLNREGFQAEKLSDWVNSKTGIKIKVSRPIDYTNLIITIGTIAAVLFGGYMLGFKWAWLCSNTLWAVISIAVVLCMTSGQMWNHIRHPPPMGRSGRGMALIAPSSQQQYVFETYYVAFLYFVTSLSVVIMGDFAGNPKTDNSKRRIYGFLGAVMFVVIYSMTLSTFRNKYQGYPYKLLF